MEEKTKEEIEEETKKNKALLEASKALDKKDKTFLEILKDDFIKEKVSHERDIEESLPKTTKG